MPEQEARSLTSRTYGKDGIRNARFELHVYGGDEDKSLKVSLDGKESRVRELDCILRDVQMDRARDELHVCVCKQYRYLILKQSFDKRDLIRKLLLSNIRNRHIHHLLHLLRSKAPVHPKIIAHLLALDKFWNSTMDDVISDMIIENQINRKADAIIINLQNGIRHVPNEIGAAAGKKGMCHGD